MFSYIKEKIKTVNGNAQEGSLVETASDVLEFGDIDSIVQDLKDTIYDNIRTIKDPEKPNNLEELEVVREELVHVYPFGNTGDKFVANIEFIPTIQHCSLAPLIGLCIRKKLENTLVPGSVKVDIFVKPGTHSTVEEINKQINDKERVAAALENHNLRETVELCIKDEE